MAEQTQTYSKDYIDGVMQAFKTVEVYLKDGGNITMKDLNHEIKHYQSLPVAPPTKRDLSKFEISEKSKEVKELNKDLKEAEANLGNVMTSIFKLKAVLNLEN